MAVTCLVPGLGRPRPRGAAGSVPGSPCPRLRLPPVPPGCKGRILHSLLLTQPPPSPASGFGLLTAPSACPVAVCVGERSTEQLGAQCLHRHLGLDGPFLRSKPPLPWQRSSAQDLAFQCKRCGFNPWSEDLPCLTAKKRKHKAEAILS